MRCGDVLVDRFVVESMAGRGGMGEVYRASDRQTGQAVAIKVLQGERPGESARFEREALLLSGIEHPGIVRYVARGLLPSGDPYLVMEWLEGEDLGARLERGPLDAAAAVTLGIRVADALGALHDRGIVHRDIKPSNIFLVGGHVEEVKLLDFGIARNKAASLLTGSGVVLGTASYMAPEQASDTATIDARADVFSLGCVLFECLSGDRAFGGVHVMAILAKILFEKTPSLRDRCPKLPASLSALVDRMLSKSPEDRLPDGHAVEEALQSLGEISSAATAETIDMQRVASLTGSEQRAVAVIFIGIGEATARGPSNDEGLAVEAASHGGRFERLFDGSAAVILSGLQVATDLAAQAARCALSLRRYAHGRRIALAIGRSDETMRQPLGPVIDRAARLLGGTDAAQSSSKDISLDEATVGLLDARFEVLEDRGTFVLRAERDIAEVRTLLGKPTPCVGRTRELRRIEAVFDECAGEEQAQAVLVTGGAGMGKSRIGREIIQRLRGRDEPPSIWIARGELLGAGAALGMLAELVRGACAIRVGEALEARREKLRARIAEHVPEALQRRVTEFLGEIIGASFPDEDSLPLFAARQDAQLMRDQIRAAFIDFLGAECEIAPVFILLEDLHWGDAATVRILDTALRDLAEKPLFVLALARPEVHEIFPKLWSERGFQESHLNQLSKKASEELVRHVLGERVGAETLARIVGLADGNAFYLEELIRATAEGKASDLPETVVAMVQARLAALPEMQRRVLRAASIFGESFWASGVEALLGDTRGEMQVATRIRELVDGEFVTKPRVSRFAGEEEYTFRHALLREGAYAMLTEEDKKVGHRLAGEWLEQRGENDPLVLGEHFQKGGEGEKAAVFYSRAAAMACSSGDSDGAIRHAKQGLDTGASGESRLELIGIFCEASAWKLEVVTAALPYAEELLRIAPRGSKPWLQGIFAQLAGASVLGRNDVFFVVYDALRNSPPPADATLFVSIAGAAGYTFDMLGQVGWGDALIERASEVSLQPGADKIARALCEGYIILRCVSNNRGNPWRVFQIVQRLKSFFQSIGDRRSEAGGMIVQGMSAWYLGALEEGVAALAQPLLPDNELAYTADLRVIGLAWLLADKGALDEARRLADERILSAQAGGIRPSEARGRWVLAEILRRAGELEAAEREIEAALPMAVPLDQPGVLATLAVLRLSQGRSAEALAAAAEGMAKYEAMGACGFCRAAFLRLAHAECLEAMGDSDAARGAISRAREWLFEVAAEIGEDEYKKSFLSNVPENRRILELAERWL